MLLRRITCAICSLRTVLRHFRIYLISYGAFAVAADGRGKSNVNRIFLWVELKTSFFRPVSSLCGQVGGAFVQAGS